VKARELRVEGEGEVGGRSAPDSQWPVLGKYRQVLAPRGVAVDEERLALALELELALELRRTLTERREALVHLADVRRPRPRLRIEWVMNRRQALR
jgi:hypothetical protein